MLINVKMATTVGILTFMSRIILCPAELSIKKFITSDPGPGISPQIQLNIQILLGLQIWLLTRNLVY